MTPNSAKTIDIISVNEHWQYPAITEKHAFMKVKELTPYTKGAVYFAFPWATLIDLLDKGKPEAGELLLKLKHATRKLKKYSLIITVCQHINMLRHEELFYSAGIDVVFWSHAIHNQSHFNQFKQIKIQPFPLFPVHSTPSTTPLNERKYLFSFVGARDNKYYLTNSRSLIIDDLSDIEGTYVKGRKHWHYNNTVYKKQIYKTEVNSTEEKTEKNNAEEFKSIMEASLFALCPSGSGPNSIRLWESIEIGVIPVIISDTYLPPGPQSLWVNAVIFCNESKKDITKLPNTLKRLKDEKTNLAHYISAANKIKALYGKDVFVYDINQLIHSTDTTFFSLYARRIIKHSQKIKYAILSLLRIQ